MAASRRLSQAISEGDGISYVVAVDGPAAARAAQGDGAEALVVRSGREQELTEIRSASSLPILVYFEGEQAAALDGADACVIHGPADWLEHVHRELAGDFELAIRIERDEQIEEALERFDPEIFLLAGESGDERLEHVLHLLSDVPAGKLAIAELFGVTDEEIAELERAGCDAVLVGAAAQTR